MGCVSTIQQNIKYYDCKIKIERTTDDYTVLGAYSYSTGISTTFYLSDHPKRTEIMRVINSETLCNVVVTAQSYIVTVEPSSMTCRMTVDDISVSSFIYTGTLIVPSSLGLEAGYSYLVTYEYSTGGKIVIKSADDKHYVVQKLHRN